MSDKLRKDSAENETPWIVYVAILGLILFLVGITILLGTEGESGLVMFLAGITMILLGLFGEGLFGDTASDAADSHGGGNNRRKRKDPYYKDFAHKKAVWDQIEKNLDDIF